MEGIGVKRKSDHNVDTPHKAPRTAARGGGQGKMSFAQRMMAKMGYVEGQGLGKEGEGIVNPIEVKQRPQGAGVGTVKEKTTQAKAEERRRAETRGETYEDSSEDERARRKDRRKGQGKSMSGQDAPFRNEATRKKKVKYQTVADIQAAAPGLVVPTTMLGSILDVTGSTQKMLTSTAGIMLSSVEAREEAEIEKEKIEKRERLELEAFIDAWHGLQEQKIYLEEHEGHFAVEIEQIGDDISSLAQLVSGVSSLETHDPSDEDHDRWSLTISRLQELQETHTHLICKHNVQEAGVAALHPAFKQQVELWNPLDKPDQFTADISSVSKILYNSEDSLLEAAHKLVLDDTEMSRQHSSTTAYESMLYTTWLPKLRTTIRDWSVLNYQPMIDLVQSWRPLLPRFILNHLIDRLIVPKLTSALQIWDPRARQGRKHNDLKHASPSSWIFPWLPLLSPYQLDGNETESLMAEVRRRLRQTLSSWDVALGIMPDIQSWKEVLSGDFDQLLIKYLLPRLSMYMTSTFDIDPSDQKLEPLQNVFAWQVLFKPDVMARLLAAEFFPKWLATLHLWLTSEDASFDEIGQWLTWWREQIPEKLAQTDEVLKQWAAGTAMVNAALDLLDAGQSLDLLPRPAAGPVRPIDKPTGRKKQVEAMPSKRPGEQDAIDFKDAVESWCAEEDLTLVPLREAHTTTGLPLFRITASASGKGGVIVYLKGDVVWAQRKGDRTVFEPVGLEESLVKLAEGR